MDTSPKDAARIPLFSHPEALVLTFLDHEFQDVSKIPERHVADYCLFALILSPRIIASPSFFAESEITRRSMLSSQEFFGTEHVTLSFREANLEAFFKKKLPNYSNWKTSPQYRGYYTVADELIDRLRLPIRHRTAKIGKEIARLWRQNALNRLPFSFYHMTNVFKDNALRESILQAVSRIPDDLEDKPFIWPSVCSLLDTNEPRWRLPEFEKILRSFLLKCYFEALCEPTDAIVAFSDFPNVELSDLSIDQPVVPLSPLRNFLIRAGVVQRLRNATVLDVLAIVNSAACREFRIRYIQILNETRTVAQSVPISDGLLGLTYTKAVNWGRLVSRWVADICGKAGLIAKSRREDWTVQALLDDAAARGFVDYLKSNESLSSLELLQKRWMVENLGVEKTTINNNYMNQIYKANVVGVMGQGAHNNNVTQAVSQDSINLDLQALALDLNRLHQSMLLAASNPNERDAAIQISHAEVEAKAGNASKALGYLKSAGSWAFEQAKQIGAETASAAIMKALGLS